MQFIKTADGDWRCQFESQGFDIIVHATTKQWTREAKRKTRIYASGYEDVDFDPAYAMAKARDSLLRGTDDETDKLFDKLNRQQIANMRAHVLDAALKVPEIETLLADDKIHFSRKAGCSCGCSPGFILDGHAMAWVNGNVAANVTDIFIGKVG